jgi:hypothetical protein
MQTFSWQCAVLIFAVLGLAALAWKAARGAPFPGAAFDLSQGAATLSRAEIDKRREAQSSAQLAGDNRVADGALQGMEDLRAAAAELALRRLHFEGQQLAGDDRYAARASANERAQVAAGVLQGMEDLRVAVADVVDPVDRAGFAAVGAAVGRRSLGAMAGMGTFRFDAPAVGRRVAALAQTEADAKKETRAALKRRREAGELTAAGAAALGLESAKTFTSDPQNVHDPGVVDAFSDTVRQLRARHGPVSHEDMLLARQWAAQTLWDSFASDAAKLQAGRRFLDDERAQAGRPEAELLALVHKRATAPENRATAQRIGENLALGMAASGGRGACKVGRDDDILSALTLLDRGMEGVAEAAREEDWRNAAMSAASAAAMARAEELAADTKMSAPLRAAAREYIGEGPETPDANSAEHDLEGQLVAAAMAAAQGAGLARLRPAAADRVKKDIADALEL